MMISNKYEIEFSKYKKVDSMGADILSENQYLSGTLKTDTTIGKGTIIEYVVLTTLGDCVKESFNFPYDLTSKKCGEINVKSSSKHNSKNGHEWAFGKQPESYIPDYFICVGLNESYTEILHVWKIPGDARVIGSCGIHIIDNPKGLKRVSRYEVDPFPYNEVYRNIDISTFPEFENTYNEGFKQNRAIAQSINEGYTLEKIKAEYGDKYYQEYLKWISDNNLKKYFHINTGLVGVFPSNAFIEMTEFTFPVFDIVGEYVGYVNVHDFIRNRMKEEKRDRKELIRNIWDSIKQLTENGESASINSIRCKTSIEDPERYLTWMLEYGDIVKTGYMEYKCKNSDPGEKCITERVFILRDAFITLSKLNKIIYLKQLEAVSGLNNIDIELKFLGKRGNFIQVKPGEFRWV